MKVGLEKISSGLIDRNNKILGVPSEYLETAAKRVRNTHRHGSETIAPEASDTCSFQTSLNPVNKMGFKCEKTVSNRNTNQKADTPFLYDLLSDCLTLVF